jgi:hypothetical protein
VPQVEIDEINRLRERPGRQDSILAQAGHDVASRLHLLVRRHHHLLGVGVDALDQRRRVTLHADLLHRGLSAIPIRPRLRDRVGEVIRQPIRRIVRHFLPVQAAHVAGRAGRHEHVARRQRLGRRVQLEQLLLRMEHDAVLRFLVNLEL